MASGYDQLWQTAVWFIETYLIPNLIVLAIAFLAVAFAFDLNERNAKYKARRVPGDSL